MQSYTEPPFSGEYDNYWEKGTYICRKCQNSLYRYEDKFDARCGWPAFDAEILNAVKKIPDSDGVRTEIVCAKCLTHLGHVFVGENLTTKNVRHCVNSYALKFIPFAVFGGGCFWCLEAFFKELKGVINVTSGYSGGIKENPSYQEVCTGKTGHAEVIKIDFDPDLISFETLLEIFFEAHDPTTLNQQGNDVGTQYRSIILFTSSTQEKSAKKFLKENYVTEIKPFETFYPAEEYHQNYFSKNPNQPYCSLTIAPKIKKLREKYKNLLFS